ncbi:hypothetical protein NUU61_004242, partial [Penicillium alfredii]
ARNSIDSNYTLKRKLIHQKQYRRKINLIKKIYEYSKIYNVDIYVGIRLRETGQGSYYLTLKIITDQDLEKAVKPINCEGTD